MKQMVGDARRQRRICLVLAAILVAAVAVAVPTIVIKNRPSDSSVAGPMPCEVGKAPPAGGRLCTFADEFSGTSLDADKWLVRTASSSGIRSGACQVDSPRNVSVRAGHLNLTVRREAAPLACRGPGVNYPSRFSNASVGTWNRFSQTYGRFEIRARFPPATAPGLQSALWLYPQALTYGAWPRSGEIDIAESYSLLNDSAIPYVHYASRPGDRTVTNRRCKIDDVSSFHTYAAEWTPQSVTITYDDEVCLVHRWNPAPPLAGPAPFDKPFIVLLSQGLGIGANAYDPASTTLPATTQIDYVHVWS